MSGRRSRFPHLPGGDRLRGRAWRLALPAALLVLGCASDLVATGNGYRNTRDHYRIGVPGGPGPPWRRIEVDGAWIAFRRPGPQTLSLQSRCGAPVGRPAIMARTLVVGVGERTLLQAGPIAVLGRDGWAQTFDIVSQGVPVRVKTVTAVIDHCVFDWTLAVVGEFEAAERAFDAWLESFQLDPPAAQGEEAS